MSYKVFLKWVFKTEFVMILIALFFSVITEFMMSFVFFDEAAIVDIYGINQITGYDSDLCHHHHDLFSLYIVVESIGCFSQAKRLDTFLYKRVFT